MAKDLTEPCKSRLRTLICIPTFHRTGKLTAVLEAVIQQASLIPRNHALRVLVIDNDPHGSARHAVEALIGAGTSVPITYTIEERQGIGHVRNRGFSSVKGDEWLVFFDDDQLPNAGWLSALLKCRENSATQVVFGPVTPVFEARLPDWGQGGWAWGAERSNLVDGQAYRTAGFGNVLFSSDVLQSDSCRVPQLFCTGPGEDTAVSLSLRRAGFGIVYRKDAAATELVEAERITTEWVLNRAEKSGSAWHRLAKSGLVPRWRLTLFTLKSLLDALGLFSLAASDKARRSRRLMQARYRLMFALGTLKPDDVGR